MEEHIKLLEGQYYSISEAVDAEMVVQRSRFIASLRKVHSHPEFDLEMKGIMQHYPKATHYCWAYRFNDTPVLEHASDAGEPAGTAGRPILGALKKYSLLNTMVVVTRYYGGIKLGVKGLISAYGGATLHAIEKATVILDEPKLRLRFSCQYDMYNILLSRLERQGIKSTDIQADFTDAISGEIILPFSVIQRILPEIDSISCPKESFSYGTEPIE